MYKLKIFLSVTFWTLVGVKMNLERPFWETSYSEKDAPATFNKGNPSWDVIEVLENHLTKGKV